jgi:ATP-binding cassette subfamily C exporter for protease/lipase
VLGPQLGYLPQDVELFDATIADNIGRLGDVQPAEVVAAARAAGLHDAILQQPKGYDTPIGEAGRLVAGGLRQRIGLARALYGEPQLLVLDEPDAHLDEFGRLELRRALEQLKAQGRTVFLMTHLRSGLASLADKVIVLHDGAIAQEGVAEAVLTILRAARPPSPVAAAAAQPPLVQAK